MRFVSTAAAASPDTASPVTAPTDLATAIFTGLAADGGLYLPESLPAAPKSAFVNAELDLADRASLLLDPFLEALEPPVRRTLLASALDFPVPLVELEDGIFVLELFHGPTCAFKDVGARTLARLMAALRRDGDDPRATVAADETTGPETTGPETTVLVATSGDTGSAVAQAFAGVEGTRVAVLYPHERISPLQEKQMATLGGNVMAIAVDGSFDDCQRLVKAAFRDPALTDLRLTSANSINIGRLLPQMVYYADAASRLANRSILWSVPSGNFGNLTAGLMARRMGLPARGFVAATNANDVVPAYLRSGVFDPRPSSRTMSSAMDVGDPSNLARIRALFDDDRDAIRRQIVVAESFSDEATASAIRDVERRSGYVLDPHTAVGYLGLRAARERLGGSRLDAGPDAGVVLATAHPIKFREHVEPIIGRALEVPERLRRCLALPSRAHRLPPREDVLRRLLLDWPTPPLISRSADDA